MHHDRTGRLALLLLSATACSSSSDFAVADDTGGTASDTGSVGDVPGETPADGAVDPCADEPGKNKFCLEVTTEGPRPGYAGPDASTLVLDGKGVLQVFLFDKDPRGATLDTPVLPVATLHYGAIGEKVAIDKLPVTLVDRTDVPGKFWVIASFADTDRAAKDTANRPGDFVSVPLAYDDKNKPVWQTIEVTTGKTARDKVKLRALRRLDLSITAVDPVTTMAKAVTKYVINGDGPAFTLLYDGTLGGTDQVVLGGDTIACLELQPKAFAVPLVPASILTTVTGNHNLFVGLVDFQGCKDFPCRGTIMSNTGGTLPTVDVKGSDWIASATVRMTQVLDPYTPVDAPVVDLVTCKK